MTFKHRDLVIAYMDGEEIEWRIDFKDIWDPLIRFEDRLPSFYADYEYRIKPKEPMYRLVKFTLADDAITILIKDSENSFENAFYKENKDGNNLIYLTDWLPFPPGTKV